MLGAALVMHYSATRMDRFSRIYIDDRQAIGLTQSHRDPDGKESLSYCARYLQSNQYLLSILEPSFGTHRAISVVFHLASRYRTAISPVSHDACDCFCQLPNAQI